MNGLLSTALAIAFSSLAAGLLVGRRNVSAADAPTPPMATLLGHGVAMLAGWIALAAAILFAMIGLGGEQTIFVLPLILSSTFLIAIFGYRVWPAGVWTTTAAAWLVCLFLGFAGQG